jgi:hypothetical protein
MKKLSRTLPLWAGFLGCAPPPVPTCEPEPVVSVKLEKVSEDVRALPVLASGRTRLLGVSAPDMHGEVRVNVRIANAPEVQAVGLRFEEAVNGVVKDLKVLSQTQNDQEFGAGGAALEGGELKFRWRTKNLADYLLPPAKPHSAKVTLDWKLAGKCGDVQTGVAAIEVPGLVKAVASAANLALAEHGVEIVKPDPVKGNKVRLTLGNAVGDALNGLKDARIAITYFGKGLSPEIGFGTIEGQQAALVIGGAPRTDVQPTELLSIHSSPNAAATSPTFDHSGAFAATGTLGEGRAVVTLTVSSVKKSTPGAAQVDTFAEWVEFK